MHNSLLKSLTINQSTNTNLLSNTYVPRLVSFIFGCKGAIDEMTCPVFTILTCPTISKWDDNIYKHKSYILTGDRQPNADFQVH